MKKVMSKAEAESFAKKCIDGKAEAETFAKKGHEQG